MLLVWVVASWFMEPGEEKYVEDLIKGIAVASANDGCVAMAEHLAGSEENFVKRMNAKAKELGMKDTNFVNTNGLPIDNHYTSAYDISIMSKELIKHEKIAKFLSIWIDEISVGKKKDKKIGLVNTNKLIRFYKGANGIKTGFTNEAKFCVSASATRDNLNLIAVVLGSPTSKDRFSDATSLLNYGFANYETIKVYNKYDVVKTMDIEKSAKDNVALVCKDSLHILIKKGDSKEFKKKIDLCKDVKFPIKKGQKLGTIEIYYKDKMIHKSDLVSLEEIKRAGYGKVFRKVVDNLY